MSAACPRRQQCRSTMLWYRGPCGGCTASLKIHALSARVRENAAAFSQGLGGWLEVVTQSYSTLENTP